MRCTTPYLHQNCPQPQPWSPFEKDKLSQSSTGAPDVLQGTISSLCNASHGSPSSTLGKSPLIPLWDGYSWCFLVPEVMFGILDCLVSWCPQKLWTLPNSWYKCTASHIHPCLFWDPDPQIVPSSLIIYIYIYVYNILYIYTVYVPLIGWVMFDWGPCLYFSRVPNHASGSDLRPPVRLLQVACVWLIKLPCLERVHSSYHVKVVSAVSLICSGKIWPFLLVTLW